MLGCGLARGLAPGRSLFKKKKKKKKMRVNLMFSAFYSAFKSLIRRCYLSVLLQVQRAQACCKSRRGSCSRGRSMSLDFDSAHFA
jgi:hypothetical protein